MISNETFAGHLRGFEFSWKCISVGSDSGKIVFEAKGYRDCTGPDLLNYVTMTNPLYTNYGGPVSINMGLLPGSLGRRDLSPPCYDTSLQKDCYNSAENSGVYEQFYYRSGAVSLQGVPDSNGTKFYFTYGGMPPVTNTATLGGYFIRIIMYPHINPNTGKPDTLGTANGPSCYDSSPRYVEDVPFLGFIGVTNYHSNLCKDIDGDQVVYSFDSVPTTSSTYYQYAPGFSGANPFPNTYHHGANVPLNLDPNTGNFTFTPFAPTGEFLIGHKTTSYRNGQKIAEVFRTYIMILDSLPSDKYNRMNKPPKLSFKNNSSSTFTSTYADTFAVGDVLHINVKAEDYDSLHASALQSVSLRMIPQTHQIDPNNPNNCNLSHCAYLDTNNVAWKDSIFSDTSIVIADLLWTLDCELLGSINPTTVTGIYKTYHFSLLARDNICPFPLTAISNISVTVKDSSDSRERIRRIEAEGDSNLIFWPVYNKTSPFGFYKVYRADVLNGTYSLLHTATAIADTSYMDTSARATQKPYFYKVESSSNPSCNPNTNVVRSLHLEVSITGNNPKLDWNDLTFYQPVVNTGTYEIFSDTGMGWQSRATLSFGARDWTDSEVSCRTMAKYYIEAYDQTNDVEFISNIDSVYVGFQKTVDYEICQGDSILLSGAWRFNAGTYPDTVPAGVCDTLVDRVLKVNPTYSVPDTIRICDGDSVKISGVWRKQEGVYPKTLQTTIGCDSVVNYQVLLKTVYENNVDRIICNGDSFFDVEFGQYFYSQGQHIKPYSSSNGCDSNYVLTIDERFVNVGINLSHITITAQQNSATYQWFDCISGMPVQGATSQSFTPSVNGSYAASVTYEGCTDTTDCVEITGVGFDEYNLIEYISIYPNPNDGYFKVQTQSSIEKMRVYNIFGKLLLDLVPRIHEGSYEVDMTRYGTGIYVLEIKSNEIRYTQKIVVH